MYPGSVSEAFTVACRNGSQRAEASTNIPHPQLPPQRLHHNVPQSQRRKERQTGMSRAQSHIHVHPQMCRKRSHSLTIACVSTCSYFSRLLVISELVTTVQGYVLCEEGGDGDKGDCTNGNPFSPVCQDGGPGSDWSSCQLCVCPSLQLFRMVSLPSLH